MSYRSPSREVPNGGVPPGSWQRSTRGYPPSVIDSLNMAQHITHQLATWGEFSEEIHDYLELGLLLRMNTPESRNLQAIVDPFTYRKNLRVPKLMINGTNDRYWPLDLLCRKATYV